MVCGSRSITNKDWIFSQIEKYEYWHLASYEDLILIQGGARGVDKIAKEYAQENDWKIEEYPAEWDKYGKSAGHIRNEIMVKAADEILILWDGKSPGTLNDLRLCKREHKPYTLIIYPNDFCDSSVVKENYD